MYRNVLKIPKMIPAFRSSMLTMAADTQATNKNNVRFLPGSHTLACGCYREPSI